MSTCCMWIVKIERMDGSTDFKRYLDEQNAIAIAEQVSKEHNVEKVEVYRRWCS